MPSSAPTLPRILFVLGKGGVGRSTISAALGAALAERGEHVLVVEWTVAEAIAPWFGKPPAGAVPVEIAPRLSVANYALDATLRSYFVDHLRLPRFYRHVVDGPHLRRLIEAAPGIAELMFLGNLWWLTTLAAEEAGLRFDRVIVDAPATGHGASLLALPATLATMGAAGLLAFEVERVVKMMADPAWTGALVVSLPEELSVEETLELMPRATHDLGRRPLAALVNRSVARLGEVEDPPADLEALATRLSPAARDALATVLVELRGRSRRERALHAALEGATELGTFAVDEQLLWSDPGSPRDVVRAIVPALAPICGGGA